MGPCAEVQGTKEILPKRAIRMREAGRQRKMSAFTLVEMLVVVSIILVVAVVALPAFTSLATSSSRRTAVSLTIGVLDQARARAVAHSSTHYLVFADADAAWPEAYRGRAFAIFEEVYEPRTGRYRRDLIGNWERLPNGTAWKPDKDTVFGAPTDKFDCRPAGRELHLPFFKFNSIGAVDLPANPRLAQVRIFEGFFNGEGVPVSTNPARAAAEETVRVSLLTGRAKREEVDARS
ncbi:MAG: hypothetical protein QOE70_3382 [Chthoniobacter sp.]|jgi:prepilin-type N-terminal cleavage/methylation domain-containing protein|nr:hypothetical protein [Chthoniobacter sp.]